MTYMSHLRSFHANDLIPAGRTLFSTKSVFQHRWRKEPVRSVCESCFSVFGKTKRLSVHRLGRGVTLPSSLTGAKGRTPPPTSAPSIGGRPTLRRSGFAIGQGRSDRDRPFFGLVVVARVADDPLILFARWIETLLGPLRPLRTLWTPCCSECRDSGAASGGSRFWKFGFGG